jgi:hypothetical protein
VTCVIRFEAWPIKKPRNPIPNKSKDETEENIYHKKNIIKRMRVKLKIKNKLEGIKNFK